MKLSGVNEYTHPSSSDLVVLGTGSKVRRVSPEIYAYLKKFKINLEVQDTVQCLCASVCEEITLSTHSPMHVPHSTSSWTREDLLGQPSSLQRWSQHDDVVMMSYVWPPYCTHSNGLNDKLCLKCNWLVRFGQDGGDVEYLGDSQQT